VFAGGNVFAEEAMLNRILISAMTLAAALLMSVGVAAAFDDAKYLNLVGGDPPWLVEAY